MKFIPKIIIIGVIVLIGLVLFSCQTLQRQSSSVSEELSSEKDFITFIGMDGDIYTIEPDSGRKLRLTNKKASKRGTEHEYHYPTWSNDGKRIAFVDYSTDKNRTPGSSIYVVNKDGSGLREIFRSARHIPFYLYWDPTNSRVSFISTVIPEGNVDLLIASTEPDGDNVVTVETGHPYYWSWSPDGRAIVSHVGGSAVNNLERASIGLIQTKGMNFSLGKVDHRPAFFKAPAFSPDGRQFAAVVEILKEQNLLVLFSRDGRLQEVLANIHGIAAFEWSPVGNKIAYVDGIPVSSGGIIGPLTVLDLKNTGNPVDIMLDRASVIAFFWSPDGKRIAYFQPIMGRNEYGGVLVFLNLFVLDVESGDVLDLGHFLPTAGFLNQVVPYYDQYQRSSTIWSPDGTQLVINGITEKNKPGIYVVSALTDSEPRRIDLGTEPFWSGR